MAYVDENKLHRLGGADEGDAEGEEAAQRGKQPVDYQAEDNLCGGLEEPVDTKQRRIYALSRGGRREGSEERGAGQGGGRELRREEQGRPEAGSRG